MSDMTALLNDLSYIPSNNEHNEPTQGDIDGNKDLELCPVCYTSRWKDSNTPGKKVPKKVLRYFSIIHRLQCLYKSSHTAKEMIWHATGKCTEPGKMQHLVDGRAWKNFDTKYPDFAKEPRNVRLGLAADGFNPDPPKEFSRDEILGQIDRLPTRLTGVKLPDGFGSCFKHKVTDNDTNITGLKSHDCHIMMQRLLHYGLQNYLLDKIAKPIIELCSLFKQICSATLMEDDMLKAHIKVIDILCNLELIYPPALFDIMIHLVIYLALEALEGGSIRPRWMYPFERYMKKLKGYVRNKAKPEGSIAEGYVAEEALTFSSHYFWDVTIKLNRPDRNVDPPLPTCQFQVFRSVCKSIGLRWVIWFDAQELKKVKWYVLHNSPEIDTYWSQFKSLFLNKYMKEEFLAWFGSQICQRHVDNDKDPKVSTTNELFALACGPTWTPISINSCVVDGVSFKKSSSLSICCSKLCCFELSDKSKRNPNLGGRAEGRLNTCDKTQNLSLKEITDTKGPVPIQFELPDKQTAMPLGDHVAHWSSYIGEVIRGVPLYYPSWLKVPKERKAALITDIGAAHRIPRLDKDQRRHLTALAKSVQYQQGCFQGPTLGYRPYDRDLQCGEDQAETNIARAAQNRQNRAKCMVISRQGSQSLTRLRDEMFESGGASGSGGCGDEEEGADHQDDEDEDGDGDT
nr:hypothetical protein [Tanacetum cinerariifolium]